MNDANASTPWWREITRPQWLALTGTTLGWGLEGFDVSLYTLVLVPAVSDLLGPTASEGDIRFHAGLAVALFLCAWALGAVLFGSLADRFGRVKVLDRGHPRVRGVHRRVGVRAGLSGSSPRCDSWPASARASRRPSGRR